MKKLTIGKRKRPIMPEPMFEDNWKQEKFDKNVKSGIASLKYGKEIHIYDDGRGYELACEIKRQFILEYQKQLSEKIRITNGAMITIKFQGV